MMVAGKVVIPSKASWLLPFLDEMSLFPNGAHDDQVDAFVGCLRQAIRYDLTKQGGPRVHDLIGINRQRNTNPIGLDMDDPKYWDR